MPWMNVPSAVEALSKAPGDEIVYTKAQAAQMLEEIAIGQRARIALMNLRAVTAVAASAAGACE